MKSTITNTTTTKCQRVLIIVLALFLATTLVVVGDLVLLKTKEPMFKDGEFPKVKYANHDELKLGDQISITSFFAPDMKVKQVTANIVPRSACGASKLHLCARCMDPTLTFNSTNMGSPVHIYQGNEQLFVGILAGMGDKGLHEADKCTRGGEILKIAIVNEDIVEEMQEGLERQ